MSSNPVTALLPPPIQEKHSPPIPLTPASTRNTPPAGPGSLHQRVTTPGMPRADSTRRTPIISADDRIAAARQLRADTPVLCDLLAERRTLIAA